MVTRKRGGHTPEMAALEMIRAGLLEAGHAPGPLLELCAAALLRAMKLEGENERLNERLAAISSADVTQASSQADFSARMRQFLALFPVQAEALRRASAHWLPKMAAGRAAVAANKSRAKLPPGPELRAELQRMLDAGWLKGAAKLRLRKKYRASDDDPPISSQALNKRLRQGLE